MMRYVDEVMLRMGVVSPGDLLVITGTAPVGAKALTNFIKLHQAGEE
jgi:pyruvate kinase